ncbi:MAG: hypothetical protein V4675_05505 [Verrucomicrobiota bacterium]
MNPRLIVILAGIVFFTQSIRAQEGVPFLTGRNLDYLGYNAGALYWKASCLFGGSARSIIERTPVGSPAVATYFHPATCDGLSVRSQNIAMDAARNVYWATGDGRIVSLGADAVPGTVPVVLANMGSTALPQSVHITVSASYVYWAETFGETGATGNLYRVPVAGGTRQTIFNFTATGGGGIVGLHALGNNGATFGESILYQRWSGRLARATEQVVLPGQDPWAGTEGTVVNSVEAWKVFGGRIYYAETTNGAPTLIRSRNITGLANVTTLATLSTAGLPYVSDIAADSRAVYWRESRNQTGPIWRHWFSGGTPEPITVNLPSTNTPRMFLESDGRALYWRSGQSEIRTHPVNSGSVSYDIEGRAVEVVQAIQSQVNDVPLVAEKTTWVRAFGRFTVDGANVTQLDRLSIAQLHGTRSGVALPGSPLQPSGGDGALLTTDADRTLGSAGSWFRLPLEWTTGSIVLRAEFNAERVVPETSYSNNSEVVLAQFTVRDAIHLKASPLRTQGNVIGNYLPVFQPVFDLAEAMLPTPQLTVAFGGSTIEEWNPPFPWDFGPYELSKSDDDSGWVLFKLGVRSVISAPALDRSVHDVAFFHPFFDRAFNGKGRVGSPKVLISNMALEDGTSGFNAPLGGVTLAHELGHNFGRDHVDCGKPANPDPNYKYDPCQIADLNSHQGWNPLSQRLITATAAGDLMSYRAARWTSDYTWRAIYSALDPGLFGRHLTPLGGTGASVLLGGVIMPSGAAELHPAIPLPDATAVASANQIVSAAEDLTTWRFVVRRANGTLLKTVSAGASSTSDDGPMLVHAVTGEDPEAANVSLEKNSAPGIPQAMLSGGGAPPVISITSPAPGAVVADTFTLRWEASDPEGLPLRFQVRHSHDRGATWQAIADEVRQNELVMNTATVPGGAANDAVIEVLASDGLSTATAKSAFFTIAAKAPSPVIVIETERGRTCGAVPSIAAGETLNLRGSASDAEDGTVSSAGLAWTVTGSTGIIRSGSGRELLLRDLPPASYSIQLRATDSDNQNTTATGRFDVRAFAIPTAASAPVMDGYGDDAAYLTCRHPLHIRYATGTPATVRAVVFGTTLYVAMTGMPSGAAAPGDLVSVAFDANNSGETAAQATDIRFIAMRDGEFYSARGDGAGGFGSSRSTIGFTVRVTGDAARWHAEYAIPLATIGAASGQTVGMDVSHDWVASAGDDYHWFASPFAAWNRPRDWPDVRLAPDPDDPGDVDLDGIADVWELENLGTITADGTGDNDGDGQSDRMEFQAGTDPNSRLSLFTINSLLREGRFLRVGWPSASGRLYTVETSNDLLEWQPFCIDLPGTGTPLNCLIDPALPEAGRYFRVRGQRCP